MRMTKLRTPSIAPDLERFRMIHLLIMDGSWIQLHDKTVAMKTGMTVTN